MKHATGKIGYAKTGYRLFNFHVWMLQAEGFVKVLYGATLFGFSIDFSSM